MVFFNRDVVEVKKISGSGFKISVTTRQIIWSKQSFNNYFIYFFLICFIFESSLLIDSALSASALPVQDI